MQNEQKEDGAFTSAFWSVKLHGQFIPFLSQFTMQIIIKILVHFQWIYDFLFQLIEQNINLARIFRSREKKSRQYFRFADYYCLILNFYWVLMNYLWTTKIRTKNLFA